MNENQLNLSLAILERYLETKSPAALTKFWQLYPHPIPSWHLNMMNDEKRNQFYEKEIQANVKDKIVIDLGCGGGLLTQMALEAGAKHIYAVEQDRILQKCFLHTFKEEINSGRVTLLTKSSFELKKEDFSAGPPQIIVHEIFGNNLFGEKVIEVFDDLFKRNILDPLIKFIPQKFTLFGCLHNKKFQSKLSDPKQQEKFWFMEDLCFVGRPSGETSKDESEGVDVSPAFEVFAIDLKSLSTSLEIKKKISATSEGNFLRVWFELYGDESTLSSDIGINKDNHWGNSYYFLKFQPGEVHLSVKCLGGKLFAFSS